MKSKILVADDEWEILELLRIKLTARNYEVVTARNEREFFVKALDEKPDLVILDIWLGDKVGTHSYQNLMYFGFDEKIPVIYITALERDTPTHSAEGGKVALFSKPFDFDELMGEIEKMLGYQKCKLSA